ncbi:hypothetical protein HYD74_03850 [Mycoplasmopsis bovis]|nr:hypothetical protein HYD74_03850 [Mycoplasmopsis bovis]
MVKPKKKKRRNLKVTKNQVEIKTGENKTPAKIQIKAKIQVEIKTLEQTKTEKIKHRENKTPENKTPRK